jgi:Cu/Ag efflux pump CusA
VILFLFKQFRIALLIFISVLGISGSFLALCITHTAKRRQLYRPHYDSGYYWRKRHFTFLQFQESAAKQSVDEAIIYSISTRLRPKLMTALGAIIALMPLALGIGAGAQLHQPLAISVIGGFIVALPLLLIVLPSMLRVISPKEEAKG